MPDDFYIAVKVPYEKAQKARTYREWELIVARALEDAKWMNKTAAKSYWTRAIWDDLGRPKVDDARRRWGSDDAVAEADEVPGVKSRSGPVDPDRRAC